MTRVAQVTRLNLPVTVVQGSGIVGEEQIPFNPVLGSLLRPCDSGGGTTRQYVTTYGRIPWANTNVWDWKDKNGTKQGSFGYASFTATSGQGNSYVYDVTSTGLRNLVEAWRDGSLTNHGLIVKKTAGDGQLNLHSKESGNPTTQLICTLADASVVTITNTCDVHLNTGSGSTTGAATAVEIGTTALFFDVSGISQPITSVILRLRRSYFYGNTVVVDVFRVDLDNLEPSASVEQGVAQGYVKDSGLDEHPGVYVVEHFPSYNTINHGWYSNLTQSAYRSIIGDVDPDGSLLYEPLASGIPSLKVTVGPSSQGPLNLRWLIWGNTGKISEPTELYMRYYLRLADNWDPTQQAQGGKLMGGFDGTYHDGSADLIQNWLKADAPPYAGNGGQQSTGCTGWSFRGGYDPYEGYAGSPLADADYRIARSYAYYLDGHIDESDSVFGSTVFWKTAGFLQKNRWYCIEQHIRLNTLSDGADGTRAYYGDNVLSDTYGQRTRQYRSASDTPRGNDTAVNSTPYIYYGNKTGIIYPSGDWPQLYNNGYKTDTAILQSSTVGRADGQYDVWIDGKKLFTKSGIRIRHLPNVCIWGIWLDMYAGGTQTESRDCTCYATAVVLSDNYIGPMGGL